MNENFEKYIEGLSPELQEKARACKTKEELNAFIEDNDLELPEDALEMVSGGCGTSTPKEPYCKKCGSKVSIVEGVGIYGGRVQYICPNVNCGTPYTFGGSVIDKNDVEWR